MITSGQVSRLPSLDGWRAISIALVLGSHCPRVEGVPPCLLPFFNHLFDGDLGVRFFFVISGFLITWLLAGEMQRNGQINLRHFYIRRGLRILPVSFAFIGVLALLQWATPFSQSRAAWIGNLTFTTNFVQFPSWPSGHLWSLSVEEQFYLIWPAIFFFCGRTQKMRTLAAILTAPVLIAPICRVITFKGYYPATLPLVFCHFSFLNYFDSLGVGCGCAILLAQKRKMLERQFASHSWLATTIALGLILSPYGILHLSLQGGYSLTEGIGPTLQAFGFAILMLHSIISPTMCMYRSLNWSLACRIGILSYSIYIWQQLFCSPPEIFGLGKVWWMSFPGWLIAVITVAVVSYYGLERPLFKMRAFFRDSKPDSVKVTAC